MLSIIRTLQKHSSRMCTDCLQTMHVLKPPDVSTGGGPQVNRFEQASSLGHQMSLVMEGWGQRGSLYSEVKCSIGNGHMGSPTP